MYYRRKVMLALFEGLNNQILDEEFSKYLFLYTKEQENQNLKPSYFFVPGVVSFQANADKTTMTKYGLLAKNGRFWNKIDSENYTSQLKKNEKELMKTFFKKYSHFSNNEILKYLNEKYSYYTNKPRKMDSENMKGLFTIGYEGISLEEYVNKLLKNNVNLLIDVRKNAFSMKYGFSKNQLEYALKKLGIKYLHVSNLGIDSSKRQDLNSREKYNDLFEEYEERILHKNQGELSLILEKLKNFNKIALTCFEKDPDFCHRKRITNVLCKKSPEIKNFVFHL
jgi:hypothetical protein